MTIQNNSITVPVLTMRVAFLLLAVISVASSFSLSPLVSNRIHHGRRIDNKKRTNAPTTNIFEYNTRPTASTSLSSSPEGGGAGGELVRVTTPSPDIAAGMGIREWPQQFKSGSWKEEVSSSSDTTLVRYVLEGTGTVDISSTSEGENKSYKVRPGTLLEVSGPATLSWTTTTKDGEMIILTPNYEEGGTFLGVVAALVVLCGALIAGVGSS